MRTVLEHPEQPHFQRIDAVLELAPAGQLVAMEYLAPPDPQGAREICGRVGEARGLEPPATDDERLAFARDREASPALRGLFETLRATAREGARTLGCWGGLDVRPGNVLQDARGVHKLVDPYFVAGLKLIPAILEDAARVARWYSREALEGFLEIAVFEPEMDEPGEVLRQLRARVAELSG